MKQRYLTATLLPALLAWSASFEAVQEKGDEALRLGHVKEAEALYKNFLKGAADDEANLAKVRLAMVYYKDQEQEKAFETFLNALEHADAEKSKKISVDESRVYDQALKIYIDHAGLTPDETAQKLFEEFGPVYEKHPEYHHLGYILSVGYANLGQYDKFFEEFYKSYLNDPNHFLGYKAKAAMHIKLFDRAKTDAQRAEQRRLIITNAEQAAALEPHDSSLYRMILGFTPEDSKGAVLSTYLNKIIDQNIVIARIDIPYYIELAIAFDQIDLAQKFLDKAKSWYAYSRVIAAAQQRLDEKLRK